jgi:sporulation protein YlmC with PRC-barrel domain
MADSSTGATEYVFGTSVVTATEDSLGRVEGVVVRPSSWSITHLVVMPSNPDDKRLLPIALVQSVDTVISVNCDQSAFDLLGAAEEIRPGGGVSSRSTVPNTGIDGAASSVGSVLGVNNYPPEPIVTDLAPDGELQIRRGEYVRATDGQVGYTVGLLADSAHTVSHLVVEIGHLLGKSKLFVPVMAITSCKDEIQLSLLKDAVKQLKSAPA